MNKIIAINCHSENIIECTETLSDALKKNLWIQLQSSKKKNKLIPDHFLPKGPGFAISSSGSGGSSGICLQPCSHLNQSAIATGEWLQKQNIKPSECLIMNSLPLHHISGLMPWWRSKVWKARHQWINPEIMKSPNELVQFCKPIFAKSTSKLITSLVPTQLIRLIKNPTGENWLKNFDLIWIGGATLPSHIRKYALSKKIRLAPCYGATETSSMVTSLSPTEFLKGVQGSGSPLKDVQLSVDKENVLSIRTPCLAIGRWREGELEPLLNENKWWKSGDLAEITQNNNSFELVIKGRADSAINSGGETIFLEELHQRLYKEAEKLHIGIKALILIPVKDREWGERYSLIINFDNKTSRLEADNKIIQLKGITNQWIPAERPLSWHACSNLVPNEIGKFNIVEWKKWLKEENQQEL